MVVRCWMVIQFVFYGVYSHLQDRNITSHLYFNTLLDIGI